MRTVIIDTNMLLVPGQFKVDIFSELERVMEEPYEIVILDGTLRELERIAEHGKADDRRAARLASMLLEHQRARNAPATERSNCKALKVTPSPRQLHVDDAIAEIAEDAFVATNDAGLKRRLLEQGVRVIFLKQQQYLALS